MERCLKITTFYKETDLAARALLCLMAVILALGMLGDPVLLTYVGMAGNKGDTDTIGSRNAAKDEEIQEKRILSEMSGMVEEAGLTALEDSQERGSRSWLTEGLKPDISTRDASVLNIGTPKEMESGVSEPDITTLKENESGVSELDITTPKEIESGISEPAAITPKENESDISEPAAITPKENESGISEPAAINLNAAAVDEPDADIIKPDLTVPDISDTAKPDLTVPDISDAAKPDLIAPDISNEDIELSDANVPDMEITDSSENVVKEEAGGSSAFMIDEAGMLYRFVPEQTVLEDGVLTLPAESCNGIRSGAFLGCDVGATELIVTANLSVIEESALVGLDSLEWIDVEAGNPEYISIDGVLFDSSGTVLIAFPNGRTGTYMVPAGVARIADGAFANTSLSGLDMRACGEITVGNDIFGEMAGSGVAIEEPREYAESYRIAFAQYMVFFCEYD